MIVKLAAPPFCRNCRKAIPKHTIRHWINEADRATVLTIADAQRLTNLKVVAISRMALSDISLKARRMARHAGRKPTLSPIRAYSTWDGESYVSDCFCKGVCAITFAYRIARAAQRRCSELGLTWDMEASDGLPPGPLML